MAPLWPFGKKQPGPVKTSEVRKQEVVEYDRENDNEQEDLIMNRSHLKDEEFLDAMKFFGEDSD